MHTSISSFLWGKNSRISFLIIASLVLLFGFLGTREIWTQEHRWADIVSNMFYNHDFFHPWLNNRPYYDKPLLSYWLISLITIVTGKLSTWSLRLPSAIAGVIAILSIYSLGKKLKNHAVGMLSGWMLLTTFYFIFWARTSSADMLNMAGTLLAVSWYYNKKSNPNFFTYLIFYLIIVITALCKGLIAPVVAIIVIIPDLLKNNEWKKHLRISLIFASIPAIIIYLLPFWLSTKTGVNTTYNENGLILVWRENFLRYFQPFDHKGPIYTYLIYLPVYLLPWSLFFIPSLARFKKNMLSWSVLLLFIFLSLSGSRRNYYILPVIPYAIIMTADWILIKGEKSTRYYLAGFTALVSYIIFFLNFIILQPLYYKANSLESFASKVKQEAQKTKPWSDWQLVLLDPQSKLRFYLNLPANTELHEIAGNDRINQNYTSLTRSWSFIKTKTSNKNIIYISRAQWEKPITKMLGDNYYIIKDSYSSFWHIVSLGRHDDKNNKDNNRPVAFIAKNVI